ncbi:hypothetical protein C8Q78DRAFT_1077549 [Trametes maxima]|nr:hypothetical protein C8Q78DRAFT_1077549 [Trametes maxima]
MREYMREHHSQWAIFANEKGMDLKAEDIVFVYRAITTCRWKVAAFSDNVALADGSLPIGRSSPYEGTLTFSGSDVFPSWYRRGPANRSQTKSTLALTNSTNAQPGYTDTLGVSQGRPGPPPSQEVEPETRKPVHPSPISHKTPNRSRNAEPPERDQPPATVLPSTYPNHVDVFPVSQGETDSSRLRNTDTSPPEPVAPETVGSPTEPRGTSSPPNNPRPKFDQCVFIGFYRIRKRLLGPRVIVAAAGPHDLPRYDEREGMPVLVQARGEAGGETSENMSDDRHFADDPLSHLLDYILENSTADMAIASHHELYAIFDNKVLPANVCEALAKVAPHIEVDEFGTGFVEIQPMKVAHEGDVRPENVLADNYYDAHFARPSNSSDPGTCGRNPYGKRASRQTRPPLWHPRDVAVPVQ